MREVLVVPEREQQWGGQPPGRLGPAGTDGAPSAPEVWAGWRRGAGGRQVNEPGVADHGCGSRAGAGAGPASAGRRRRAGAGWAGDRRGVGRRGGRAGSGGGPRAPPGRWRSAALVEGQRKGARGPAEVEDAEGVVRCLSVRRSGSEGTTAAAAALTSGPSAAGAGRAFTEAPVAGPRAWDRTRRGDDGRRACGSGPGVPDTRGGWPVRRPTWVWEVTYRVGPAGPRRHHRAASG